MFHMPVHPPYIQQSIVRQATRVKAPWIDKLALPAFATIYIGDSAITGFCRPAGGTATPPDGKTALPEPEALAPEAKSASAETRRHQERARGRDINGWNPQRAIAHLQRHSSAIRSHYKCAEYVANAIEAGGIRLNRDLNPTPRNSACGYGEVLQAAGFKPLPPGTEPQAGDVVVIQPVKAHPDGHMAMFDGNIWYSDFRQSNGMYPNAVDRIQRPPYTLYRRS